MNPITLGIFIITVFSTIAVVLSFILFDMIKTGTTYGRKIPMPSKRLIELMKERQINQIEVIDAEIVANKKIN